MTADVVVGISEGQVNYLESAILAAGIQPDSRESFKRLLRVLRFIESERHWKHVIRGFRLREVAPTANRSRQFSQARIDAMVAALRPWGMEHFDDILRFVPCLSPSSVGIARAIRNMSKDIGESAETSAAEADISQIFHLTGAGNTGVFAFGQSSDGRWQVYQQDDRIRWKCMRNCSDQEADRCCDLSREFKFTWHMLGDGSNVVIAWTPL